jgi:hypothetical protein
MTRLRLLATLAAILALTAVATTAPASAKIRVGIGDQNAGMFADPLFKQLKVKRARVITPWNVALKRRYRKNLDGWLKAARAAHVTPLVTFGATPTTRCPRPRRKCRAPTVKQYIKAFKRFRKRYPRIREIAPWNEANHRSQPTFAKPKRAAQYFNAIRKRCRGCRIVAADVIDEKNMVPWLKVFKRTAKGERIWGLHNYKDTNPRRGQTFGGTAKLLRTVRGQVWLTETGGIVKFKLPGGRTLFRFNEKRANKALKRMFHLARKYQRRVKRLYIYNWSAPLKSNRFDAGLVRRNGKSRPGYATVKKNISRGVFRP